MKQQQPKHNRLQNLASEFVADTAFLEAWQQHTARREASIPRFRDITTLFIAGALDMKQFRDRMDQALQSPDWGARGSGFLLPLNQLARSHGKTGEMGLRHALTGLNASNLGQRIEQFFHFLSEERARLRQGGQTSSTVSPSHSGLILSLFAHWLDEEAGPPIYSFSLRRGLKMLLDAGLLPQARGVRVGYDSVEITTDADHRAVMQALESLDQAAPILKTTLPQGYTWAEIFLLWVTQNSSLLEGDDARPTRGAGCPVIAHSPLAAVPAPLLSRQIARLRRVVLVDEAIVRRIYRALLVQHVILTGPPGTGKTALARLIPELLWQTTEEQGPPSEPRGYTTRLVTATDEWSVRTLIGGLAPVGEGGQVRYHIQYGHLTETLLENWAINPALPAGWQNPQRVSVRAPSVLAGGEERLFLGRWLVIDEFNRAPIDLALGEALTALGDGGALRVPIEGGSREVPFPQDFRIIGTLNSFDRTYLNQISEALKRRFAFIEIAPPARSLRMAEQAIVLFKALERIAHISDTISVADDGETITWDGVVRLSSDPSSQTHPLAADWQDDAGPFRQMFGAAWSLLECIRIYRQIGTAQAITLFQTTLIEGMTEGYGDLAAWSGALDAALCDTVADQLQVLLPDELETVLLYLNHLNHTLEQNGFIRQVRRLLARLESTRRRAAHLDALGLVLGEDGRPILPEHEIASLLEQDEPAIGAEYLAALFNLGQPRVALPLFARRLRASKAEHSL